MGEPRIHEEVWEKNPWEWGHDSKEFSQFFPAFPLLFLGFFFCFVPVFFQLFLLLSVPTSGVLCPLPGCFSCSIPTEFPLFLCRIPTFPHRQVPKFPLFPTFPTPGILQRIPGIPPHWETWQNREEPQDQGDFWEFFPEQGAEEPAGRFRGAAATREQPEFPAGIAAGRAPGAASGRGEVPDPKSQIPNFSDPNSHIFHNHKSQFPNLRSQFPNFSIIPNPLKIPPKSP